MVRAAAVAVAIAACLAASSAPALATHSPGQGGPNDFIVGAGKVVNQALGEAHLSLAAHSGPAGEDPWGRARLTLSGLIGSVDAAGDVQCLSTSRGTGNGFAELDQPLPDGSRFLLFDVIDLQGFARPDEFFWAFSPTRPPRVFGLCLHTARGIAGQATGNLVVHDAPPLGPQF